MSTDTVTAVCMQIKAQAFSSMRGCMPFRSALVHFLSLTFFLPTCTLHGILLVRVYSHAATCFSEAYMRFTCCYNAVQSYISCCYCDQLEHRRMQQGCQCQCACQQPSCLHALSLSDSGILIYKITRKYHKSPLQQGLTPNGTHTQVISLARWAHFLTCFCFFLLRGVSHRCR